MTLEDIAFDRLLAFLDRLRHVELVHAHPPSGKSYVGDLVQFPAVVQERSGAQRSHVDFIACSKDFLYLGELKGRSSESVDDVVKLLSLISELGIKGIRTSIRRRLTRRVPELDSASRIVPIIGCTTIDSIPAPGILYLEFGPLKTSPAGRLDSDVLRDLNLAGR